MKEIGGNMRDCIYDEQSKIDPDIVASDFETSVNADVIIWYHEENMRRWAAKETPLKFSDFETICELFWKEKLS